MPFLDLALYVLMAVNALVYAGLAFQLLSKPKRRARALNIAEAFEELGAALTASVPGLPKGFTWREGVERVKTSGFDADWTKLGDALRAYEGIRYGGERNLSADFGEVIALAESLEVLAPVD